MRGSVSTCKGVPRVFAGMTDCVPECPDVSQTATGKLSNRLSACYGPDKHPPTRASRGLNSPEGMKPCIPASWARVQTSRKIGVGSTRRRTMAAQLRRVLIAVLMMSCSACGYAGIAGVRQSPLYTVTTSLMQKPGQNAVACFAMPLPYPPIGCGGPEVVGVDLQTLPGFQRYRNGVVSVGTVRLVGSWRAGTLALTQPPESASPKDITPVPQCAQTSADPAPDGTPEGRKLMSDPDVLKTRGIQVLEFYVCQQALFVVVSVADNATVKFMSETYAPVKVAGWLRLAG